jgi:hypothetical protein
MMARRESSIDGRRASIAAGGADTGADRLPRWERGKKKRRRAMPERVARRPDPDAWRDDELVALHEAVALLWPDGPLTVSMLRTAIAKGQLGHLRIAGRIYTSLAAMTECRRTTAAGRGGG